MTVSTRLHQRRARNLKLYLLVTCCDLYECYCSANFLSLLSCANIKRLRRQPPQHHLCFYGTCFYWLEVHVNTRVHPGNPSLSKAMHSKKHQGPSLKVFYEGASAFLPNEPTLAAVCGRKEPLREESLITRTQRPAGALQFQTLPSISTHTI